jgi:hypothetical protein
MTPPLIRSPPDSASHSNSRLQLPSSPTRSTSVRPPPSPSLPDLPPTPLARRSPASPRPADARPPSARASPALFTWPRRGRGDRESRASAGLGACSHGMDRQDGTRRVERIERHAAELSRRESQLGVSVERGGHATPEEGKAPPTGPLTPVREPARGAEIGTRQVPPSRARTSGESRKRCKPLKPTAGLEPATPSLRVKCSTN